MIWIRSRSESPEAHPLKNHNYAERALVGSSMLQLESMGLRLPPSEGPAPTYVIGILNDSMISIMRGILSFRCVRSVAICYISKTTTMTTKHTRVSTSKEGVVLKNMKLILKYPHATTKMQKSRASEPGPATHMMPPKWHPSLYSH